MSNEPVYPSVKQGVLLVLIAFALSPVTAAAKKLLSGAIFCVLVDFELTLLPT